MISIRSNIMDKLKPQWGEHLIGKMATYAPTRYTPSEMDRATKVNEGKLYTVSGWFDRDLDKFIGYDNEFVYFLNHRKDENVIVNSELMIDDELKGKVISVTNGVFRTDRGESFSSKNYTLTSMEDNITRLESK